jgi:serine/threonine-protein kinase
MPTRVGRYEVISHLATGGMAQIYLARQTGLGAFERHVVLKTILRERATDQRFVTMFLDEAKLAATLNHQNIAQVYEVDQADGAYFMAMEYVHGENARAILETTLRRGWTIPLELAVMIISGAAAGLHHAHERRGKGGQPLNIVHRDVSPANIMVGYDGSVKVLDFGIAKAEERATKTVGGTIKGKYGYMSPEQCKGKPIDRRSDIFALGICLYELTTLRRAFKGNDDFETMKRIVAGDVILPSVAVPGYPRELEAIVLTAMANDVNARFQTAQEMIEALDAFVVRAKLTGSNTSMGRFMVQLFGSKKEPWVEGGQPDRTQITETSDEIDPEQDEKTQLIEDRQPAQRITQPGVGYAATAMGASQAAAAEWQQDSRTGRPQSPRPSGHTFDARPNGNEAYGSGQQVAMGRLGSQPPGVDHSGQARGIARYDTEPGSRPLVDERLGWQTGVNQPMMQPGTATRLDSNLADINVRLVSSRSWVMLACLMIAGVAAGVLIAWQSSGG